MQSSGLQTSPLRRGFGRADLSPQLFRNELACSAAALGLSLAAASQSDPSRTSFAFGADCSADSEDYYVTVLKVDSLRKWGRCTLSAFGQDKLLMGWFPRDSADMVRFQVIDAAGAVVRSIAPDRSPCVSFWTGEDDRGGKVPVGNYRVRLGDGTLR